MCTRTISGRSIRRTGNSDVREMTIVAVLILAGLLATTRTVPAQDGPTQALLTNGSGDGSVSIVVDAYGAFGHSTEGDGAVYDPFGRITAARTVWASGLYVDAQQGFLNSGFTSLGPSMPPIPFELVQRDLVVSRFRIGGLAVQLTQSLSPRESLGSEMTQTYQFTNETNGEVTIRLVRHIDADLFFQGDFSDDFGGVSNDGSTLFQFDSGDSPLVPTTVIGISAEGGVREGFTIQPYSFFDVILGNNGIPGLLMGEIFGDNDGDNVTDTSYDVTCSLQDKLIIPAGETGVYATKTSWGQAALQGVEFIDPNPDFIDDQGRVIDDREGLGQLQVSRNGATTDGVTRLVLRIPARSNVTFAIESGDTADGTLSPLGSDSEVMSLEVRPELIGGRVLAFAVYNVPEVFSPINTPDHERIVNIQATISGGVTSKPLKLQRPPVILVHGLWGGAQAWPQELLDFLGSTGFGEENRDIWRVHYGRETSSFHPAIPPPVNVAVSKVIKTVRQAVEKKRQLGVASTQVDVVAHGLGGLAVRSLFRNEGYEYSRRENFFAGDLRKFITVGTPHLGSELARWLSSQASVPARECLEQLGFPLGDALRDIIPASRALAAIGETPLRSHTLGGVAPDSSETEKHLDALLRLVQLLGPRGDAGTVTVDDILCGDDSHDTFVPVTSQLAGRAVGSSTASSVLGLVHSSVDPSDEEELRSFAIHTQIFQLLRSPITSDAFAKLEVATREDCFPDPAGDAGLADDPEGGGAGAVSFVLPGAGTTVEPGSELSLAVERGGATPIREAIFALERVADHFPIKVVTVPAFETVLTVPAAAAGRVNIKAVAVDEDGRVYSAESHVIAVPASPLEAILPLRPEIRLTFFGEAEQLIVFGRYEDGTVRDITSPSASTRYDTVGPGGDVLEVSAEGRVVAVRNGQETVLVSHESLPEPAAVLVTVEADNHPPRLDGPGHLRVAPGEVLEVPIGVTDPDDDRWEYGSSDLPGYASLTDNGDGTAVLTLQPGDLDLGVHEAAIVRVLDDGDPPLGDARIFDVTVETVTRGTQMPGDCNGDGQMNLTDPVCLLGILFLGSGRALGCGDGSLEDPANVAQIDVNGDTRVTISDPIYMLNYLFLGGTPPRLGIECTLFENCPDNLACPGN